MILIVIEESIKVRDITAKMDLSLMLGLMLDGDN